MREALLLGTVFCRVLQGNVCQNEIAVAMELCSLELLLMLKHSDAGSLHTSAR